MGAGGMYPNYPYTYNNTDYNYPYPNNNTVYNRPYYNHHGGHPPPGYMPSPSYGYPPTIGMNYGRGFHPPYPSMPYGPMVNGFPPGVFHNQISGRGFLNSPRTMPVGVQSIPPNDNLHVHRTIEHRHDEHRSHFDEH
ncbi:unnamed protein product [Adineta steineri]|uniref:Uncharacterized protein n=1 Tax=Adineta steineri TaxID=433720 RepID=A0A815K8P8_9BILA|nr:unnamed protein product [Adineta steineri]CAF3556108.1 unnamed protein product [Adineta steineri]